MPISHSDLTTSLVSTPDVIAKEIGNFKENAGFSEAEKLLADGLTKREDSFYWGAEIERITKEIRRLEKVREFFLEPIKEAKKTIEEARKKQSSFFDGPVDFLTELKKKLSSIHGAFTLRCEQEDKAALKAEQDAKLKAIADAAKVEKNDFMAEIAKEEVLEAEPEIYRLKTKTMTGSTSYRMIDRVEVVDAKQVPREYCMPDVVKLLADYKSGLITEIPGVRFWQEPTPVVR